MDWPGWLNAAAVAAGSALGGALIQGARWWWDVRRANAEKSPNFVLNIFAERNSTGFHTAVLNCRNNAKLPILVEKIVATGPRDLMLGRGRTDEYGNLMDYAEEVGVKVLEFEWECSPIMAGSKAQWSGYLNFFARRQAAGRGRCHAEVTVIYRSVTSGRRFKMKLKSLREISW